ncbi:MAG: histidine kinase dimerization/phosphoacceptor domain -containing protein [Caulobacteraceae bacterium]
MNMPSAADAAKLDLATAIYGGQPAITGDSAGLDVPACDVEAIHIPGAIQPHGLLLVAKAEGLEVIGGAGDIEGRLTPSWLGRSLGELLGEPFAARLGDPPRNAAAIAEVIGISETFDASARHVDGIWTVQLEPASPTPWSGADALAYLDNVGAQFEKTSDLRGLLERAVGIFRELTGYDRVMIYRFLDDGAGVVIAEDRAPQLSAFLNHHFPASDIPRQARALYIRNRVRVIPDVDYAPAPLRPANANLAELDLSDVDLRSVSPVHVQYLKNMGVAASASISIVKDGVLWGLVACHACTPRLMPLATRMLCQTAAGGLARQIRAKEEAEDYRDRLRLRASEDAVAARLAGDPALDDIFAEAGEDLRKMMAADGFAVLQGKTVSTDGRCPDSADIREVAKWLLASGPGQPFQTRNLAAAFPPARHYSDLASGLMGVVLSSEEPIVMMWFRAEQPEVVNWGGNPHKAVMLTPGATLTPRTSFESWSEEVRGISRPWALAKIEALHRLTRSLYEARQTRRIHDLNRDLTAALADKDGLLLQKDYLIKEVNHRIQNSLQLVSAFLAMQSRSSGDEVLAGHLSEAQRRLSAVALVHRRLYSDNNVELVDLSRYLEELCQEMKASMGEAWAERLSTDFAPILISADRAVNVGLILTELVINANKYAYGGAPGPVAISLEQHRNRFRLIVADNGSGKAGTRQGFGTRMLGAMVDGLKGEMDETSNAPGLRVIVTAPIIDA